MFGSAMFETVIGMVFVFLTVSLAVTAGNELLASLLKWRAKILEAGLERLLGAVAEGKEDSTAKALVKSFNAHPLIESLAQKDGKPSYISPRTFATVLLLLAALKPDDDVAALRAAVENSQVLPKHLKVALSALLGQVAMNLHTGETALARLQQAVESWFDGAMDRVGGWYKRRTQYVSLGLSMALALALNIDSLEMAQGISKDTTLRQTIVAQAVQFAQKHPAATVSQGQGASSTGTPEQVMAQTADAYNNLATAVRGIQGLGLPIGWSGELASFNKLDSSGDKARWCLAKVLGLILTAVAASLGAPFWFDVLSKLISVRGTGKVPAMGPKGSKDPKPVPDANA